MPTSLRDHQEAHAFYVLRSTAILFICVFLFITWMVFLSDPLPCAFPLSHPKAEPKIQKSILFRYL